MNSWLASERIVSAWLLKAPYGPLGVSCLLALVLNRISRKKNASVASAPDASSMSEVDSNGRLHDARCASGRRRTKRAGCLQQLAKLRPATNIRCSCYRSKSGRAVSIDLSSGRGVDTKARGTVDISKIRSIEKVVRLPSQLDGAILSNWEILEEGDVGVEYRRQPDEISLIVANAAER